MKKLLLSLFLLVASVASAQLMDPTKVPVLEPPVPHASTSSVTSWDWGRWLWGNWQYRALQRANARIVFLQNQIATTPTGTTGGATAADITAIKASLATLDTKINALTSTAAFIASTLPTVSNIRVTITAGAAGAPPSQLTISWDYNNPKTNVTGYRVEVSSDGTNFTLIGTTPDANTLTWIDKGTAPSYPFVVGSTRWYRVKAYSLVLAAESGYSNVASTNL